jgi:hypothetical protein
MEGRGVIGEYIVLLSGWVDVYLRIRICSMDLWGGYVIYCCLGDGHRYIFSSRKMLFVYICVIEIALF